MCKTHNERNKQYPPLSEQLFCLILLDSGSFLFDLFSCVLYFIFYLCFHYYFIVRRRCVRTVFEIIMIQMSLLFHVCYSFFYLF